MSKPRSQNVQYEITDNFLKFWFNYFDRNQTLVEMGNYDRLREIVLADYPTYSGRILEKYFRLKMMESHEYMNIGSWWKRRKGKEVNEIDIVGIKVDDKTAVVAEVKRQRRNYDHKLFMEKVECIKSCLLMKYDVEIKLFTLENM